MSKIKYTYTGIFVDDTFLLLSDIVDECNKIKLQKQQLVILKIEWSGHRGWDGATERRVLPRKVAQRVKELMLNKQVYFGEIAGKHSEIWGNMDEEDFQIFADKKDVLKFLKDFPNGVDYDHSFIDTFLNQMEDGEYEDMTEEEEKEFSSYWLE